MTRTRPTLLYDGACGVCTRGVELGVQHLPDRVDWEPFQTADLAAYGLSEAEVTASVHLVEPSGRITAGATAAGRLLVLSGGGYALLGHLVLAPPVSWVAAAVYRLVTVLRHRIPVGTPALARRPGERPGETGRAG
jgi:predicted DCC family thiol-disulfide oxidoreductase YuxK